MKRLILVGAGHAHAQVLQKLAREPLVGVETLVISPYALAPYSGMVPGWLGGQYSFDEIAIDFAGLSHAAGAKWVTAELKNLNPDTLTLSLNDGQKLTYDVLSLNIGSTLDPPHDAMLSLRPLTSLKQRYETLERQWKTDPDTIPTKLTAIGAGLAGVESLLALHAKLQTLHPHRTLQARLVTRSHQILPDLSHMTRWLVTRRLEQAGIRSVCNTTWKNGMQDAHELVLWATGAKAHAWQQHEHQRGSLSVSEEHFIRIDPYLRSVSHNNIFAMGDCAHWPGGLPKAGVYAVRMGEILCHNLYAALGQGELVSYHPQSKFLTLLNTADGEAIASWGVFAARGQWAMCWKDRIDRRFVQRFNAMASPSQRAPS